MATTSTPIERRLPGSVGMPGYVLALAGVASVAGVIHVVAAIEHVTETWSLPAFFAVVGVGQLVAGWRIYHEPADARLLRLVAAGSAVVALLWIFSRTTGIPFGPEAGKVSSVGVADTISMVWELVFVAIVWRAPFADRWLAWLGSGLGIRLTCAVLSMTLFMAAVGGHEH